jgi:ABC-2 type transport system permease protein
MNKILTIFKHEFITTISRKGFIIGAIIFPLIGLAAIGIYQFVQSIDKPPDEMEISKIGYIDSTGNFQEYANDYGLIELMPYEEPTEATEALLDGDIEEYFIIPDNYLETGLIIRYHTKKELEMSGETYGSIRNFLQENLLEGQVSQEVVDRSKNPLNVQSIRLDETGALATDQGGFGAFILPMIFGFLLIATIASSSGYLLQGLGEEKENRVIEILLSSVSTRQLLIGKVLGLGTAGLLQMVFWLISSLLIVRLGSSTVGGFFETIQIPDNVILLGIIFYILGYFFFAVIMAGLGAIAATAKEGTQLSVFMILPAIFPFYVGIIFLRNHPDHVIGTILTLFPITAPMSVFVRIGLSEIVAWEIAASIILLIIGIIGGLWLAAKSFRAFLLMYGKAPRIGEIFRILWRA